jgi:endonuclease III
MINAVNQTNKHLALILPNTNKALAQVLQDASPQELQMLSQAKDLGSLLDTLLKRSANDTSQDKLLLELLKNNPTLKQLGSTTETLKELLRLEASLQSKFTSIKNIDAKDLQQKFKNSGIFLESNIKDQGNQKEIFSNDIKAVLLKTHEEIAHSTLANKQEILKQIDKLLLQIDYHQLVSHLSNASSLYLPYSWDDLQEGTLNIVKTRKNNYFCDIHLKLMRYGELDLRLALFEKNQLSINIQTKNESLQALLQENIQQLKKQLVAVGLSPKDIRFMHVAKQQYKQDLQDEVALGFEVKV